MVARALKRAVARVVSELQPAAKQPGLRVLLYHSIGSTLSSELAGLSTEPARFRKQMERVARSRPMSLADWPRFDGNEDRLAVTLDDGYRDNLTRAAPILAELKIPFTVFVVPQYVGSGKLYLNLAELKELSRVPGCSIGSHGMRHLSLAHVPLDQARAELEDSKKWLQDALGKPATSMSYPCGSASRAVRDLVAEAGYTLGACSHCGVNEPGRDPLMLRRTEIISFDGERVFEQKLSGRWDWLRVKYADPLNR